MPIFPDASPEDLGWKTVNPGLYFTDKFVVARGLTGAEEKEYEEAHKKPKPEVGFVGGLTNEWGAVEIRKAYGYEEGLAKIPMYQQMKNVGMLLSNLAII